jgi:Domain of unknown function (DUF1839)
MMGAAPLAASVWGITPDRYQVHALHSGERLWPDANCYVDIWIEVLNALGLEPLACMSSTLVADFEGDQWTFFKPSLSDLEELYGITVDELNVWRSLVDHVHEQVRRGRLVIVEVDSFNLPDDVGTTYRTDHAKTAIGIHEIDLAGRRLGYFHGGGYHRLEGDDFDNIFRLVQRSPAGSLQPYAEIVKLNHLRRRPAAELAGCALRALRRHLARRPVGNPFSAFRRQFTQDAELLMNEDLAGFHRYAFANFRQFGASFELAALFLRWLAKHGEEDLKEPATAFHELSQATTSTMFKIARAVRAKRPMDMASTFDGMEASWERGMGRLIAEQAT